MAGPPEDFNNERTRYRDVGRGGGPPPNEPPPNQPPPGAPPPPAGDSGEPPLDPFGEETEPTPWYRRPVVLIAWALTVLVLIGLIVFGIVELIGDQGATSNPKTTTTTPHTSTTTTAPATTSTTPTTTPTTTATTAPTESSQQPEPQPTQQPTRQEPTRRHHWPSWLPTTVPAIP